MAASTAQTVRWGVVATGNIARTVTGELRRLEDSTVTAVSSRVLQRAEAFAAEFDIPTAYDAFTDLIADPEVDVVYVATPHAQHPPIVRAALEAGKPVLVEKSMTTSLADTEDLVALARARGVFLMEAMWTRFTPLIVRTRQLIADGAIGLVRSVSADLGFPMARDPEHRLWDPRQGGGATLDLLVYPAAFAQMILGDPATVAVTGSLSDGVDTEAGLLLGYEDGARAFLDSSMIAAQPGAALIVGTEGRIEIPPRFHHPTLIRHVSAPRRGEEHVEEYRSDPEGRGYVPMLRAVAQAVREGRAECPEMPLADSVAVMRVLQSTLDGLDLAYPEPDPVVAHGHAVV
jgi:predicted dehydrogenase